MRIPATRTSTLHPALRIGMWAWAALGVALAAYGTLQLIEAVRVVVIPLLLATFPAAVLAPAVLALTKRGLPRTPATLLVLLALIAIPVGVVVLLIPQVSDQIAPLGPSLRSGLAQVETFLASGPFGLPAVDVGALVTQAESVLPDGAAVANGVLGAAAVVVERVVETLLGLVALFFYLRDGDRIATAMNGLLPASWRVDAAAIGAGAWNAIGGYLRGQLLIAGTNAVLVGSAVALLGVPLALPLGVVVFIGGL
jgi:predicted PurR-regulated permease PerM